MYIFKCQTAEVRFGIVLFVCQLSCCSACCVTVACSVLEAGGKAKSLGENAVELEIYGREVWLHDS